SPTSGIYEEVDADATIMTAAINVAFLDVFKEGALLGFVAGIPPYNLSVDDYLTVPVSLSNNDDFDDINDFEDLPLFFEAQYRWPLNKKILLTPGAYVIVNPNQNANNAPLFVGVIRGTFQF
ncbi:MAG: carbohydrate porin, partial [Cyanobacteria bacterium P01_H01_bin.15]